MNNTRQCVCRVFSIEFIHNVSPLSYVHAMFINHVRLELSFTRLDGLVCNRFNFDTQQGVGQLVHRYRSPCGASRIKML